MSHDTLKDDISYMRRLAEQGRSGPILGGTFLAAAGLVFGGTCFLHWAAATGRLPIPGHDLMNLWWGAFVVFAVIWLALFFRLRARAAASASSSNAAFGIAWTAGGIGIVVAVITTAITARVMHAPQIQELNASLVFAFYGTAWGVSAALARRAWMLFVAAAAFVAAPVLAYLTGTDVQLPAMGIALLLTLFVPGVRMMMEEPRQ